MGNSVPEENNNNNNNEKPRKKQSNQFKFFEDRYTISFLHQTPSPTNGNVVFWQIINTW